MVKKKNQNQEEISDEVEEDYIKGIVKGEYKIHLNTGQYSFIEISASFDEDTSTTFKDKKALANKIAEIILIIRAGIKKALKKDGIDLDTVFNNQSNNKIANDNDG